MFVDIIFYFVLQVHHVSPDCVPQPPARRALFSPESDCESSPDTSSNINTAWHTPTSNSHIDRLRSHPLFSDLQSALALECSRTRIPFTLLQSICTPEDTPQATTPPSTRALLTSHKQVSTSATPLIPTSTIPTSVRLLPTSTKPLPTSSTPLTASATTIRSTVGSTTSNAKPQLWRPFLDSASATSLHQSAVSTTASTVTIVSTSTTITSSSTVSPPTLSSTTRNSSPAFSSDMPLDLSAKPQLSCTRLLEASTRPLQSSQPTTTRLQSSQPTATGLLQSSQPTTARPVAVTVGTKPSEAPVSDYNKSLTSLRRSHLKALSSLQAQLSMDRQAIQKSPWLVPSVNAYYQQQAAKLERAYLKRVSSLKTQQRCIRDRVTPGLFTPQGCGILESWWNQNLENPFPNAETIHQLVCSSGLSNKQVRKWFINRRHRSRKSSRPY